MTHPAIQQLASLKSDDGVLSAYIPLDPCLRYDRRQSVAQFKRALGTARAQWENSRWKEAFHLARRCPVCGEPTARGNVVDRMMGKAILAGGHVEIVEGEAEKMLCDKGGIGALVRQ